MENNLLIDIDHNDYNDHTEHNNHNENIKNNETKKSPVLFDWKYYLNNNYGLQWIGINNEKDAINHYLNYGYNENRNFNNFCNNFDNIFDSQKYNTLYIVYYIYLDNNNNWKNIVHQQLYDLKISNITNILNNKLFIILCGNINNIKIAEILIKNIINIECEILYTYDNNYEYPGINKIYELSILNPNIIFFYMHNKGISHGNIRTSNEINSLRTNLVLWKKAINVFNNLDHINKIGLFPSSGGWIWYNFWFSKGSYISTCNKPIITNDRYYYESWIGRDGSNTYNDCYDIYNDCIKYYHPYDCVFKVLYNNEYITY